MKVVIHIGFHKTGTTWFQNNFYPFVKNFKYSPDRQLFRDAILNPDYFVFNPAVAKERILFKKPENVIICEEDILGGLRQGSIYSVEIGKRLKAIFPDAEIVLFIRNQPERLASTYLYYLAKNGGTYSAKKFIKKKFDLPNQRGNINFHQLEYHRIIEYYNGLFGKEKLHVFLYEDFASDNKDFLKRYSEIFGFDIDVKAISFQRENIGLRKGLIPLARFLGGMCYHPIIHKSVFIRVPYAQSIAKMKLRFLNKFSVFGERPSAHELFGDTIYNEICNFYRESNRILIDKYNLSKIKDFNYPY